MQTQSSTATKTRKPLAPAKTLGLSPDQALDLLGKGVIGRNAFYRAIRRGEVPHHKLGKRIIIPRHAFMAWLESAGKKDAA